MSAEQIAELQEQIDALAAKNRELLGELKVTKAKARGADIDPEQFAAIQTELENTKAELAKVTKTSKAEMDKLTQSLQSKDTALQSYLIDNGLTDALVKAGVRPELMKAAKAMLRGQAALQAEGDQYKALMGDKPLADAVAEWSASDEGKHFVAAPQSNGGGATGGNGSPVAPKGNLGGDKNQRQNAIKQMFPDLPAA